MPAIVANELQDMQLRSAHVTDEVSDAPDQGDSFTVNHSLFQKLLSFLKIFISHNNFKSLKHIFLKNIFVTILNFLIIL